VARLNFSHGSHEDHLRRLTVFKRLRDESGRPVALLLDTRGPEVRIRKFAGGSADLSDGDIFILTTEDVPGDHTRVSVTYPGLPMDLKAGDRLLLDDGLIELKVLSTGTVEVRCQVVNGGTLSDNKSFNAPCVSIHLPFVSERDRQDIIFGIQNDFDFVAASFVRRAEDVKELRRVLEDHGGHGIKIIAKIENRDGVNNIDEIIRVSDGVMVARGDLGV
jgi:pyruvate kinase